MPSKSIRTKRPDIQDEKTLERELVKVSKANPKKTVTCSVTFGKVTLCIGPKPQTGTPESEWTYRQYGGFFKDGAIIQPSKTWIARFNFCPVMR
jgi:hypothetical protein